MGSFCINNAQYIKKALTVSVYTDSIFLMHLAQHKVSRLSSHTRHLNKLINAVRNSPITILNQISGTQNNIPGFRLAKINAFNYIQYIVNFSPTQTLQTPISLKQ